MVLSAAPGIVLIILGNFILVNIQTARATVDGAEYAQQSLKLSRDQFDLSKQMLALAKTDGEAIGYPTDTIIGDLQNVSLDIETSASAVEASGETPNKSSVLTHTYGGHIIEERNDEFLIDGRSFVTLDAAKFSIDKAAHHAKTMRLEAS